MMLGEGLKLIDFVLIPPLMARAIYAVFISFTHGLFACEKIKISVL